MCSRVTNPWPQEDWTAMELYEWLAVGVVIAMGLVVHSTVQLNRWRRYMQIPKPMFNYRDFLVLRSPSDFERDEVILVRIHWIACGALLVLLVVLGNVLPPEMLERLATKPAAT